MPILGAHMSIAGGYYKAIERAADIGCDCVQIFTKNNNQWRAKEITDREAVAFREAYDASDLTASMAHASYLINLASPNDELWDKSKEAFRVELMRAEQLAVPMVVVHPGAFTTSDEETGIGRISEALNRIFDDAPNCATLCLLETTAGQGSCLGWKFEQLAAIIDRVEHRDRVGVCLDTCHIFAAGYSLAPEADYEATMRDFERIIGFEQLRAIHVNDSRAPFGSRKDRHEHIGDGELGEESFRFLVNDSRLAEIPMVLETAKEDAPDGRSWDAVNLERLRSYVSS